MSPIKVETGVKGRVDWLLLFSMIGLVLAGTFAVLSAANPLPYYTGVLQRHFIAVGLGIGLFFLGISFNYQIYQDQAKIVYAASLAVLIAVLFIGSNQRGHRAWISVSFLTFQPAELARIGSILALAAFLDGRARRVRELSTVLIAGAISAALMVLILKQPDLGSAITFMPILLGMLFCAGAELSHLLAITSFGLVAAAMPFLFTYLQVRFAGAGPGTWAHFVMQTGKLGFHTGLVFAAFAAGSALLWRLSVMARLQIRGMFFVAMPIILSAGLFSGIMVNRQLKSYQRSRFVAYVAPQADIQGASYNVHQSQIAIGSGGMFGKGLFSGTQSKLGFLPERHTDFIYAVIGEEMGFMGTIGILGLYLLLIYRIVSVGRAARDRYGYLICAGLAAMFGFQLLLNVGMCVGLMPVTGVPLPLISYGGSSLVITLWAIGIVANIYARRYALL